MILSQLAEKTSADLLYQKEGRVLSSALQAVSMEECKKETTEFLNLREVRRQGWTDQATALEKVTEWTEGLALYIETSLAMEAGRLPASSGGRSGFPDPEQTWQDFLSQLEDPIHDPNGYRGRWQILGAGEAFLLDRLAIGWKQGEMRSKTALEDLLNVGT